MEVPETHYAKTGDVHVAYQVVGAGPIDLVYVPGFVSHLEVMWERPAYERFIHRLSTFSRLILVEKRGTGLSDPVPLDALPTLEQRMDDLVSVLDAVGSERAALLGVSEGCAMCVLFAATHPSRTTALALYGGWARTLAAADYPWGTPGAEFEELARRVEATWGQARSLDVVNPSVANDATMRRWWARFERLSASPATAVALLRLAFEGDVRAVLPTLRVPTLVLHRTGDQWVSVQHGRFLGERIPGAVYVELPGADHTPWVGDQDRIVDELERFLGGRRRVPEADRVLLTVLFTDIVRSTERAAEIGDRRWRELLETHTSLVRREVERHRGREVTTTGDGILAVFDGPARAVRCAQAAAEGVAELGLEIRAGVHTGEVELVGADVQGLAVHIGARVAALADAGEIFVSGTVKDLVAGSGIRFEDRGSHVLRGVPGEWRIYAVVPEER